MQIEGKKETDFETIFVIVNQPIVLTLLSSINAHYSNRLLYH